MANPYIYLLGTAWRYARKERKKYVLVYCMFILANLSYALNPILLGWFIDRIVRDSANIPHYVMLYAAGFFDILLPNIEMCVYRC